MYWKWQEVVSWWSSLIITETNFKKGKLPERDTAGWSAGWSHSFDSLERRALTLTTTWKLPRQQQKIDLLSWSSDKLKTETIKQKRVCLFSVFWALSRLVFLLMLFLLPVYLFDFFYIISLVLLRVDSVWTFFLRFSCWKIFSFLCLFLSSETNGCFSSPTATFETDSVLICQKYAH